ncbi:IS66 family transposase [Sorangium cellulosum]|uniref:Transposase IS66 central domain-containing protein n=1 Tax=Sorangium cellulosum TaxID=56 RepID=A0A150QLV0_SORCE|nr:transposase [Sorangium cellulosum]KYF68934.1 hypothetical protein BE15_47285 [Sorangium cellulosum]
MGRSCACRRRSTRIRWRASFAHSEAHDDPGARTALGFIHQLFAIDEATKDLAPGRRTEQRRSCAQPVLDAFRAWLDSEELLVLPRSPIAGATGYARNQWLALWFNRIVSEH